MCLLKSSADAARAEEAAAPDEVPTATAVLDTVEELPTELAVAAAVLAVSPVVFQQAAQDDGGVGGSNAVGDDLWAFLFFPCTATCALLTSVTTPCAAIYSSQGARRRRALPQGCGIL